jgi:hypothetical protein
MTTKEKIVFKILDSQKYHQIDTKNDSYFVKNIGDEFADIVFDKEYGWCWVCNNLTLFLSYLTTFHPFEIKTITGKWVEGTIQVRLSDILVSDNGPNFLFRVPYK